MVMTTSMIMDKLVTAIILTGARATPSPYKRTSLRK